MNDTLKKALIIFGGGFIIFWLYKDKGMKDLKKEIVGLAGDAKRMLIPAFTSVAGAARAVGAALGIGLIIGVIDELGLQDGEGKG